MTDDSSKPPSLSSLSIEGINLYILRVDKDGKIIYVNTAFSQLFEIARDNLIGLTLPEIGRQKHSAIFNLLEKANSDSSVGKTVQGEIKRDDGGEFSFTLTRTKEHTDIVLRDTSEEVKLKQFVHKYVSPNLGELTDEEKLSFTFPERRNMSLSFTDLRGFTSMSESLSPEEIRNIINTYLDETIRAVDDNHATVDKIIGDEVMALYGAPRHFKDHAFRAIKTCTDQMRNLDEARRAFSGQGRDIPECGIGIHSGDMVLGNIGGGSRQDYTVLGSAVNLASRLCSAAAPGQILCSEHTVKAAIMNKPDSWQKTEAIEQVEEFLRNGEVLNEKRQVIRIGPKVKEDPRKAVYIFISLPAIKVKGISEEVSIFSIKEGRHRESVPVKQELISREHVLRIFGKYHLIREIGRGGMGVVYEAKDSFNNRVAIKTLLAGDGASESQIKRFSREATIMAKLSHRNLCRIHEVGDFEGTPYIAMEYIEGYSLADGMRDPSSQATTIDNPPTPPLDSKSLNTISEKQRGALRNWAIPDLLDLFHRILEGLYYAHQHGVLHRDLKPANIMLRSDGEPVIMDFGLAKFQREKDEDVLSVTGQLVGTIDYIAPEQASSDKKVDERADIYSAAALFYNILTGEKHFQSSQNILLDITTLSNHRPTPPSTIRKEIDEDLSIVLLKALSPEPSERYEDVESFAADIRACRDNRPIMARKDNLTQKLTRWVRRNKALSISIGVSVIALIVLATVHIAKMTQALKDFREQEAIAESQKILAQKEKLKAMESLEQLKKQLEIDIESKEWQKVKARAYQILSIDNKDRQAQSIIEQADYELLMQTNAPYTHPPSGMPQRKAYLKQSKGAWQKLLDSGNKKAQKVIKKFDTLIDQEEKEYISLKERMEALDLYEDKHGFYFQHPSFELKFRYIPPGKFTMGDIAWQPFHDVEITHGFFMSETEIPQKLWVQITGHNPAENQSDLMNPIENVDWFEVLTFCDILNEDGGFLTLDGEQPSRRNYSMIMNRSGYRLPTEAEWEYAARADLSNEYDFWWEAEAKKKGLHLSTQPLWYSETTGSTREDRRTYKVGQHPANPWGLKDMNGNVFEWVLDTFDPYYYRLSSAKNPLCSRMEGPGVIRGGSYLNGLFRCRNGERQEIDTSTQYHALGFRLVFIPE